MEIWGLDDPRRRSGRRSMSKRKQESAEVAAAISAAPPVAACSSGEGPPYAPGGWPLPGDVWRWRVGNRKTSSGHWVDRFLYPPPRLSVSSSRGSVFHSKVSVAEYIRKEFPDKDVDEFFSLFLWKVPAPENAQLRGGGDCVSPSAAYKRSDATYSSAAHKATDVQSGFKSNNGVEYCKAGNKMCTLQIKTQGNAVDAKTCDICCSEAGFCRNCSCILCSNTIDMAHGGYSFIRCEAIIDGEFICGHVAHLKCALRSYMAGSVGGALSLDAEYYCRRCDNKTDLVAHVTKVLKTCDSIKAKKVILEMLNFGLLILRGSERSTSKNLQHHMESVICKLMSGVKVNEISKVDDYNNTEVMAGCGVSNVLGGTGVPASSGVEAKGGRVTIDGDKTNSPIIGPFHDHGGSAEEGTVYITSDHGNASTKLAEDIDKALQELKGMHEPIYGTIERKLFDQKSLLLRLYQQLEWERSDLANRGHSDALLENVLSRVDQIKEEERKLRSLMKVVKELVEAPRVILKKYLDAEAWISK